MFNFKIDNYNLELLKWIAILGMFIDHFSKLIIPYSYSPLLFELGRISFPLFAFILVYNYLYNTSSKINYLKRLFIFSLISQPFFSIAFQTYTLNIFFVLFFGLLSIFLIEKAIEYKNNNIYLFVSIFSVILIICSISLISDYKPFGIILIVSLYFVFIYKKIVFWLIFLIFIFLANHYTYNMEYGLIGLILAIILFNIILFFVIYKNQVKIPRLNKWFFYSFYPLHLVIILIIQYLVVNYV